MTPHAGGGFVCACSVAQKRMLGLHPTLGSILTSCPLPITTTITNTNTTTTTKNNNNKGNDNTCIILRRRRDRYQGVYVSSVTALFNMAGLNFYWLFSVAGTALRNQLNLTPQQLRRDIFFVCVVVCARDKHT